MALRYLASIACLLAAASVDAAWPSFAFVADGSQPGAVLPHNWQSSGFCPPDPHEVESPGYFLSEDMHQNLIYISSTPLTRGSPADPALGFAPAVAEMGGWQIRPHWALDLVYVIDPATGRSAIPPARGTDEGLEAFRARRTAWSEALTARVIADLASRGDAGTVSMLERAQRGEAGVCDASRLPSPSVNATDLVTFVSRLEALGLRAGFEVMGWPSAMTTSMDNGTQACLWAGLVAQSLRAVASEVGTSALLRWRFEGWNEINEGGDFDGVTVSVPTGVNNLWDATAAGVEAAVPGATIGAHSLDHWGSMAQAHLLHMANGTSSLFASSYDVRRADYVAWHAKGHEESASIITDEAGDASTLLAAHPEIVRLDGSSSPPPGVKPWRLPLVNDEADPREGWDRILDWRGDARYPAMMAAVVAQNLDQWTDRNASGQPLPPFPGPGPDPLGPRGMPFAYLAFDAAFLNVGPTGFFEFRSFVTRFMMNNTKPRGVESVRKLALSVMAPLALLGDRLLPMVSTPSPPGSAGPDGGSWPPAPGPVQAVASRRSGTSGFTADEVSVMVVASQAATNTSGQNVTFAVSVEGAGAAVTAGSARAALYAVHDRATDPAAVWASAGSPPFPSSSLLAEMRAGGEIAPVAVGPVPASGGAIHFNTSSEGVPATGVYLLHACAMPAEAPPAPSSPPLVHRSTLNGSERFVKWLDSGARCLSTYEVQSSSDGGATWEDASAGVETVSLAWLHVSSSARVAYRVRAVDYWGRASAWSAASAPV